MRRWWPLFTICLGSFILLVDVTIVNVALPGMARDLNSSFSALQWVIDAYALVLAALLLALGSVADIVGHRTVYLVGTGLFGLASLVCGLAVDPAMLIAARAVQGIGGAAMFATTFGLLNAEYSGRDRGTAYGIWSAVSGAAAAIGPIIGGLLTQGVSWRWIFFVNVPVAVVAIVLSLTVLRAPQERSRRRLDLGGTVAFTVAAGSLTYAITRTSDLGWSSATVLAFLAVAVLASLAFVMVEHRVATPMLDPELLRLGRFTGPVVAAFVLSFAAFGGLTYVTIWAQTVLGLGPIKAGLLGVPLSLVSAVLSTLAGRSMRRFPRPVLIGGGLALIAVGCLLTAVLIMLHHGWWAVVPGIVITGAGLGVCVAPISATASAAVGDARAGIASGAVNMARQLGQALGIALLGSLAVSAATRSLRSAHIPDAAVSAGQVVGGGAERLLTATAASLRGPLAAALGNAYADGLALAYAVSGGLAVVFAVVCALLVRDHDSARDSARAGDADGRTARRVTEQARIR